MTNHENILNFIEENLSELLKYKFLTRTVYKNYDNAMENYLIAESSDDKERMEMYEDELNVCYHKIIKKFLKVLESENNVSAEFITKYHSVLFPKRERYVDFFRDLKDDFALEETILYLSHDVSKDEEEKMYTMKKNELIPMLETQFYKKVDTWIDDLPYIDLKIFREIIEKGFVKVSNTPQMLLSENLHLLEDFGSEFTLIQDVIDTIEPFLDSAIKKKEANGENFLETLFMGIMNMVGVIKEEEAKQTIKLFVAQSGRKLDVDKFFAHSMLIRYHRGTYTCSSEENGLLFCHLLEPGWEISVRNNVNTKIPTDMLDVIAHGSYPYISPYRPCEKAFFDLLCKYIDRDDAYSDYTYYYTDLQDPEYSPVNFLEEFSQNISYDNIEQVNKVMGILTNFSNGIPKFILKGNSSDEIANADFKYFGHPNYVNTKKVGRNDPCPCGSGKKYKNCCGK